MEKKKYTKCEFWHELALLLLGVDVEFVEASDDALEEDEEVI